MKIGTNNGMFCLFSEPEDILRFLIEQLKFLCDDVNVEKEQRNETVAELLQDLQVAMTRCNSLGKRAILIIDGINKVEENIKTHLVGF